MKKAARRDGLLSHTKSFASIRRRTAQDDPGTGERLAGSRTSKVAVAATSLRTRGTIQAPRPPCRRLTRRPDRQNMEGGRIHSDGPPY
jgi:hypothetical protein